MANFWTVQNSCGELLHEFARTSPLEVARKVAPGHYDAFRLQVSSSYRELFERAVRKTLEREAWRIVRVRGRRAAKEAAR